MPDVTSITHPADLYNPNVFSPGGPDEPHWPDERPRQTFRLVVTTSAGPFQGPFGEEDGKPCPGCTERPAEGDEITQLGARWWHLGCAKKHLRTGGADEAWLLLGADLAARPSRYSVTETRAITRNLLRLASAAGGAS
ncbi:hypothetical protein BX265_6144 [Streptomyces sp. TLI_235]|nr:hypothetical protein [Streptomyces sp. TLI_235]PBC71534.1 hypothetical protein BX265_6144 [Streptomyces sp. TLI_235]